MKQTSIIALSFCFAFAAIADEAHLRPNKFCGFKPKTHGHFAAGLCSDVYLTCAEDPTHPKSSPYYAMQIAAAPGFDLVCAPDSWRGACDPLVEKKQALVDAPKVNWGNLCEAVDWSVLAYANALQIRKTLLLKGIRHVQIGASEFGNMGYFSYATADRQWLVFRGTDFRDICNEMTDTNIALTTSGFLDNLRFHTGFYNATLSALSEIKLDRNKPVYITGHSLGGAAAVIASMLLKRDGYEIASVITFGQPQIMDRQSVERLPREFSDLPLLRVINADDVVPTLYEIARDLDPYTQFGPELHVGVNVADPKQFAYVEKPTGTPHASFDDHDHLEYKERVKRLLDCAFH